ncbi:hypothetical protein ABGV43_27755 [Paenibacillus amylolyticus]|uniref:hypothetical protein n=1 Tax=Paenibacillus amylolyticus TaxID=1451 RepID=UPI003242B48E
MTVKKLFAGVLTTVDTTVYTVPDGKTAIVKSITLCNTSSADYTIALLMGGRKGLGNNWVTSSKVIKAYDTLVIPCMDYALADGGKIRLWSSGGSITTRISGEETNGLIESTGYESFQVTMQVTSTVLVPAVNYKRIIKSVMIGNSSAVTSTFSTSIGGDYLIRQKQIKNGDVILIPFMDQVVEASEEISGFKNLSTATVNSHITLLRVDD